LQLVDSKGYQREVPDIWLTQGNPWEIPRHDIKFRVGFGGKVEKKTENGKEVSVWKPSEEVGGLGLNSWLSSCSVHPTASEFGLFSEVLMLTAAYLLIGWLQVWAMAYDNPIPGFATPTTSNLRLWDALPLDEFDLQAFNAGDYDKVCSCLCQLQNWFC
jgi:starch phosphorylase